LSGLQFLDQQTTAQDRAAASAQRAAALAAERYRAGIVSFLDVVDANRGTLAAQRGQAQLAGQRYVATVQLIKALGGSWHESSLVITEKTNATKSSARSLSN
jgi:multidrug efflux system outer membrane protein